jgi:hypothetical protein
MIDNLMTIPLVIIGLIMTFFLYRKVRIDLFRDKIFEIRRSLFFIAAKNPDAFFENNAYYRLFEAVIDETLNNTEDFSFSMLMLDKFLIKQYHKKLDSRIFDFFEVKKHFLKKINSDEIQAEVSKLMDSFMISYATFLCTRTFIELIVFSISIFIAAIGISARPKKEIPLSKSFEPAASKMMNNPRFAYAVSHFVA